MPTKSVTLQIDRDRLEARLATYCQHYRTMIGSDRRVCDRRLPDGCNLDMVDKICYECPPDCPHWAQNRWKECEPRKCNYIQKVIKELTAQ